RHTRFDCDWSSDVCSSDLDEVDVGEFYCGFIFDEGGDGAFGGGVGEESEAVALGFDGDEECAGFEEAGVGGDGFDFDIGGEGGRAGERRVGVGWRGGGWAG